MEPWVHTDKSRVSSVGAALTERAFGLCRCGSWLCIRWESATFAGLFYVLPPINYFVILMGLRWLVLRRGLTESAIIRIFAKI